MKQATDISNTLLKTLRWCAEHQGNELLLRGSQARTILDVLDYHWIPEVRKETAKKAALKSFKAGVVAKFGRRNVKISEDETTGRVNISVRNKAGWPDVPIGLLAKASGFSKHYDEAGTGAGFGARDVGFIPKRKRR